MATIFVACPYSPHPISGYRDVFASIGSKTGINFVFADEKVTSDQILLKVQKHIDEADISLFDITSWNANVTLELGIAVGSKRKYFILLRDSDGKNHSIPTDIKGIDRVQYKTKKSLSIGIGSIIREYLPVFAKKLDDLPLSERLMNFILAKGGATLSQLGKEFSQDVDFKVTFKALLNDKKIKSHGTIRAKRYYPQKFDLRSVRKKMR